MKKIMMTLAAVLCCTTMLLLNSCNKPVNPPTPEEKLAAEMSYKFSANSEIQSRVDLTVEYYDADGTVKSEKLAQASFEKKVKANLPCKLGMRVLMQVKDGQDVNTMPAFSGQISYECMGYCVDQNGYVVSDVAKVENIETFQIKEGKVAEWYNENKNGLVSVLYAFKEDKTFAKIQW